MTPFFVIFSQSFFDLGRLNRKSFSLSIFFGFKNSYVSLLRYFLSIFSIFDMINGDIKFDLIVSILLSFALSDTYLVLSFLSYSNTFSYNFKSSTSSGLIYIRNLQIISASFPLIVTALSLNILRLWMMKSFLKY